MYDLEWPLSEIQRFIVTDLREIRFLCLLYFIFAALSTASKSIKQNKQLSAHSV